MHRQENANGHHNTPPEFAKMTKVDTKRWGGRGTAGSYGAQTRQLGFLST